MPLKPLVRALYGLCPGVLFSLPGVAAAQQQGAGLETVVVIGQQPAQARDDLAGALDVIGRDQLDYEHVNDTLELLNKAPGVYFYRFNQGIINTALSIRGFSTEGGSPHAKLLIDGIPSNLHSGYSELDQLFPLMIDHIQVFKGTSDPRYGLFNIAGNNNVTTRSDVGTVLQATAGSYDSRELQGYTGREDGRLTHSYGFGYREAHGYRDHTDLRKYALSGRWAYRVAENTRAALIARLSGYEGDAPGYLDEETARRHPRASADYAGRDGGEKSVGHLSLHIDTALTPALDWQTRLYRQNFERERWVRFSAGGNIQNRYDDQDHSGFSSELLWRLDEQWQLNWGLDAERQDIVEQRFGTRGETRRRDPAAVIRDFDYRFDTVGSYLQLEHTPNDWLRWNLGYRVDHIDGDFTRTAADGAQADGDIYDFGWIAQPKFNLFISPTPTLTLFANGGRSFQHPTGASAYTAGDTGARQVSVNDGWEGGLRWLPGDSLEWRLSRWGQAASDEFVVVDGDARNVGETRRRGVDLGVNWQLLQRLSLWANYSWIDTAIVKTDSANAANVGNQLRGVPDHTASLGVDADLTDRLTAKLHVDSQGGYYVNEANAGGRFGDYTRVGVNFSYATDWGAIDLQLNNLFDRYAEYVYDFGQAGTGTIHSPLDGRNGNLSVTWKL